eukprot:3180410-Rhodomonas_salina.1
MLLLYAATVCCYGTGQGLVEAYAGNVACAQRAVAACSSSKPNSTQSQHTAAAHRRSTQLQHTSAACSSSKQQKPQHAVAAHSSSMQQQHTVAAHSSSTHSRRRETWRANTPGLAYRPCGGTLGADPLQNLPAIIHCRAPPRCVQPLAPARGLAAPVREGGRRGGAVAGCGAAAHTLDSAALDVCQAPRCLQVDRPAPTARS